MERKIDSDQDRVDKLSAEEPKDPQMELSPGMQRLLAEEELEAEILYVIDAAAEEGIVLSREEVIDLLKGIPKTPKKR